MFLLEVQTGDGRSVVVLFFTHLSGEAYLGVVETVEFLGVVKLGSSSVVLVIDNREKERGAPSPKYHQNCPKYI